jgi:drug/metabolite transporter (DMT)-like permease
MSAILLAFACAFSYGFGDYFGGLATRNSPLLKVLPITVGTGLVSLLLAAPFLGAQFSQQAVVSGLFAGTCGIVGYIFVLKSLGLGPMGAVAPITALVAAFIPFSVGLFRGERLTITGSIGALIAMASIVLVSRSTIDATHPLSKAAALYAVLGGFGFAGFLLSVSSAPVGSVLAPVIVARSVTMVVFCIAALVTWKSIVKSPVDYKRAVASGALDVWGGTTFMLAAQRGQLVTISVIAALYPAITVLLARVFLKERLERHQVVGLFGAGLAIVLLTSA